ncbi:MAG: hypothetical protein V6Z86_05615 [Hyphomicrobiales bacterium]
MKTWLFSSIGTFYAIREKGTVKFLPCSEGKYTRSEPVAGPMPRLFHDHRAASLALTAWLKGRASVLYKTSDGETGIEYQPVEGRERDRMEIVPVKLILEDQDT